MNTYNNPKWWTNEDDSAWNRTKEAFKRDWDQTKHDMGGKQPDTNQNVKDTIKQAAGSEAIPPRGEPNYDKFEPAYRFGYGARSHFKGEYADWNEQLEQRLKQDWSTSNPSRSNWDEDRDAIRQGWDYDEAA